MSDTYNGLFVSEISPKEFKREVKQIPFSFLPANDVLIKVAYAALNYKDALSAWGHKGITRKFPHTPGVDAAGVVVQDQSKTFKEGDEVIVTGYDMGMNTPGGMGAYIKVAANWPVVLPKGISLEESMILGTGAFTSALALYKMELNGQHPDQGPLLVTGATGGVGSIAVSLFHKAGYEVIASTGKISAHEYLKILGASSIIDRKDLQTKTDKPMYSRRWGGVLDTVGGVTLSEAIKYTAPHGNIASCGLVESANFESTVYPFIIRGCNLLGVDSAETEKPLRQILWDKLATEWKLENLQKIKKEISLKDIIPEMENILAGKTKGRIIVNHNL